MRDEQSLGSLLSTEAVWLNGWNRVSFCQHTLPLPSAWDLTQKFQGLSRENCMDPDLLVQVGRIYLPFYQGLPSGRGSHRLPG
jgi:hypothetical protein